MSYAALQQLCRRFQLGGLLHTPEPIAGGLLHKLYKVETDQGVYAVKALNPMIMKRDTAYGNFLFSEQIARIAYRNGIPAVPALYSDNPLLESEGNYYLVFPWMEAKQLHPHEVTPCHCRRIGDILAKLHRIEMPEQKDEKKAKPYSSVTDWKQFANTEAVWKEELVQLEPLLYEWEQEANEASIRLAMRQVVSHRDMDGKNVLWDEQGRPFLIDWEAAGFVNPLQDLLNVALAWSDADSGTFDPARFEAVIESYLQGGGQLLDDPSDALNCEFKGRLDWLAYNLKRSLGLEGDSSEEQELGTRQVILTMNALREYDELLPAIKGRMANQIRVSTQSGY